MALVTSLVRSLAVDVLDLFAPPTCAACDEAHPPRPPLCRACRAYLMPPDDAPPGVAVPYEHGGPLARAIYRAKYDGDPSVAAALGALLADAFDPEGGAVDAVVPVPLHPKRLAERGYNQSAELARALARSLGARLLHDAVRRVRDTPTQTRLDREARRRNVAGAFAVRDGAALRGARVLLVDDVVTTGSTLAELRAAVAVAGAASVRAAALARAPLRAR